MVNQDRFIGSIEASQILRVDRATLLRWVQAGKVKPAQKMPGSNGAYLFHHEAIVQLAAERRAAA